MNLSRAPKSEKPRKSRTRPDSRRTFILGVDRLEQRISLSSLIPTGNTGHIIPPPAGLSANHNATLIRARPPRKPKRTSSKDRRPLAPVVEGLERRISLSCLSPSGSSGHIIPPPLSIALNHNETLVRAPRQTRRVVG
jgi:hypothetical protein